MTDRRGYWSLPHSVFESVKGHDLLVFSYLTSCADQDGECFPAQDTIASQIGISVGTVKRSIQRLAADQVIEVVRDNHQSNRYRILRYRAECSQRYARRAERSQRPEQGAHSAMLGEQGAHSALAEHSQHPEHGAHSASNNNQGNKLQRTSKRARTFAPPTLDEVTAYCRERGNRVDPEQWLNHYIANGWMVGRSKMRDWRAAIRKWERNEWSTPQRGRIHRDGTAHIKSEVIE